MVRIWRGTVSNTLQQYLPPILTPTPCATPRSRYNAVEIADIYDFKRLTCALPDWYGNTRTDVARRVRYAPSQLPLEASLPCGDDHVATGSTFRHGFGAPLASGEFHALCIDMFRCNRANHQSVTGSTPYGVMAANVEPPCSPASATFDGPLDGLYASLWAQSVALLLSVLIMSFAKGTRWYLKQSVEVWSGKRGSLYNARYVLMLSYRRGAHTVCLVIFP